MIGSVPTPVNSQPTGDHMVSWSLIEAQTRRHDYTCGEWANENNAVADFVRRIGDTRWFKLYEEVTGTHLQPRPGQEPGKVRIDAILSPTRALIDRGWEHGMIGVEIKRSGEKVGRPLAQMIDYSRSAFMIEGGRIIMPSLVLLYPWHGPGGGPFASMVAQNRLGSVTPFGVNSLSFNSSQNFAVITEDGDIELRNNVHKQGRKVGSR